MGGFSSCRQNFIAAAAARARAIFLVNVFMSAVSLFSGWRESDLLFSESGSGEVSF